MLHRPAVYNQRLLERLTFIPTGGQQWTREVQLLIPELEGYPADDDGLFIVSLGMFRRIRLPDLQIKDAEGRELNLVTRIQHGHLLADFTVDRYMPDPNRDAVGAAGEDPERAHIRAAYTDVYLRAYEMFTGMSGALAADTGEKMAHLLEVTGSSPQFALPASELFVADMVKLRWVTQYLCWVPARPGSVVRLTATYTMPDDHRLREPKEPRGDSNRVAHMWRESREVRSEAYARMGLGPVHYEIVAPANDHTSSYYFTLDPPPGSHVEYLDWGIDNSIEQRDPETRCASRNVHLHNGARVLPAGGSLPDTQKIPESKIHAFVRLDPAEHKQVVFAAFLNLIFVWLAQSGHLSSELDGSTTAWLAFAPAALIAYTAQQRRHYYAKTTRWIRGLVWLYLAVDLLFLIFVTFDLPHGGGLGGRGGLAESAAACFLAAFSLVVIVAFAMMGRRIYGGRVRRAFARRPKQTADGQPVASVERYVAAARYYGNLATALCLAVLLALAIFLLAGLGPERGHGRPRGGARSRLVSER